MSLAIKTEGLRRHFGSVRAVDGLDLEVNSGQVFGFLGPNGAGKTTTIHLLLGMLAPHEGRAAVFGMDTTAYGPQIRSRCGVLLEHNGLYERMTARQNLEFQARAYGMGKEAPARSRETLEAVDLWDRRDDRPAGFSKGMKQRLAVARAFLHRPELVFLDEPTAGYDAKAAAELLADLRTMARDEGATVFLTTHHLEEAEKACDEVAVIRSGRLVAQGSPASLDQSTTETIVLTGEGFTDRFLGNLRRRKSVHVVVEETDGLVIRVDPGTPTAPIVTAAVKAGASIEEARRESKSLEASFLAILEDAA